MGSGFLSGFEFGACTLGYIEYIVVGFLGGLSVLSWYGSGFGTGCTLSSDAVFFWKSCMGNDSWCLRGFWFCGISLKALGDFDVGIGEG